MPCKASEIGHKYQENDMLVINKRKNYEFLAVAQYADDEYKIVLTTKVPLYDNNKKLIGTFGYSMELKNLAKKFLSESSFFLLEQNINQNEYVLTDYFALTNSNIKLTKRQSETLFFIMRGKTAKEIARIFQCSPRTIEQYVEQLRFKFKCHTKSEMISKAIESGFFNYLPPRFLLGASKKV